MERTREEEQRIEERKEERGGERKGHAQWNRRNRRSEAKVNVMKRRDVG